MGIGHRHRPASTVATSIGRNIPPASATPIFQAAGRAPLRSAMEGRPTTRGGSVAGGEGDSDTSPAILGGTAGPESQLAPRRLNLEHGFMKFIVDNQLARRQYEEEQSQQRVERTSDMRKEQKLADELCSKCKLEDTPKPRRREVRVRAGYGAYTPPHNKNPEVASRPPTEKVDKGTGVGKGTQGQKDNGSAGEASTPPREATTRSNHDGSISQDAPSLRCSRQRREVRVRPGFGAYVPPGQRPQEMPT
eukprot:evm.model.scf_63.1 EVM.evm.TU.scf_63.1   scf_63:2373-3611(-)